MHVNFSLYLLSLPCWFMINFLQKLEMKKDSSVKLPQLSAGGSSGFDNNYLDFVNSLLEYWRKGQNAVVIDDEVSLIS